VAKRLFEIEKKRERGGLVYSSDRLEARDRAGAKLNQSGRNLQRYLNILDSPIEVQRAFREDHLTLVLASRVATLDKSDQDTLAKQISAANDPSQIKKIVIDFLAANRPTKAKDRIRYTPKALKLIKNLERDMAELDGNFDRLHGPTLAPHLKTLETAQSTVKALIQLAKKKHKDQMSSFLKSLEPFRRKV
jgi:hypothetical protein